MDPSTLLGFTCEPFDLGESRTKRVPTLQLLCDIPENTDGTLNVASSQATRRRGRECGFTLIELSIVIAVAAVVLGAVLSLVTAQIENARTVSMRAKLDTARSALVMFVARNSRLPCPALPTQTSADATYGLEAPDLGACTGALDAGTAKRGMLPFRSLGLSEEDSLDVYASRFTYVVTMTATALNEQSIAGAQGTITLHNDTPPTLGLAGNQTNACSNTPTYNGCNRRAIALVISHGPNAAGAYQSSGKPAPDPASAPEAQNADDDDAFVVRPYSERDPVFDDQIIELPPDRLLAPLIRDGAIRSARAVTNEQFEVARDAVIAAIVNTAGAIPASSPAIVMDGWGSQLVYASNGSSICNTAAGTQAFSFRSRGPDRFDGISPSGVNDDITRAQTVDSPKAMVLNHSTAECL